MKEHSGVRMGAVVLAVLAALLLFTAVGACLASEFLTPQEAGLAKLGSTAFPVQVAFSGIRACYASAVHRIGANANAQAPYDSMVLHTRGVVSYLERAVPALSGRKASLLRWVEEQCQVPVGFMVADSVFAGVAETPANSAPTAGASTAGPTPLRPLLPALADSGAPALPRAVRVSLALVQNGVQGWLLYRWLKKQ